MIPLEDIFLDKWTAYRDTRKATYEFRAQTRYKAVADKLLALGLYMTASILDVGAGSCQFGRYMRERGWRGMYIPIDAVIDATDLETWQPYYLADFVVCIETLEHVESPRRLLGICERTARHGLVVTTPNPEAVDVLKCDPTHISSISPDALETRGLSVERCSWFGTINDSLLAWRQNHA